MLQRFSLHRCRFLTKQFGRLEKILTTRGVSGATPTSKNEGGGGAGREEDSTACTESLPGTGQDRGQSS